MRKYEVEFALFKTCIIEAENMEEAKMKSCTMEDDEIDETCNETKGYMVWNDAKEIGIDQEE